MDALEWYGSGFERDIPGAESASLRFRGDGIAQGEEKPRAPNGTREWGKNWMEKISCRPDLKRKRRRTSNAYSSFQERIVEKQPCRLA